MRLANNFDPALEYQALRTELQESRSYVFERPLLILGAVAGIAAFGAEKIDAEYRYMAPFLPSLITALMIYNLWSTAWRQRTSSRIVAYIQTAFEERVQNDGRWWGWETCLRVYRKKYWKLELKQRVLDERVARLPRRIGWRRGWRSRWRLWCKTKRTVDPLMYWTQLWLLHIGIVFAAILGSLFIPVRGWLDPVGFMVNSVLATWFACVCLQKHPYKMKSHIELDRKVWKKVLAYLDKHAPGVAGARPVSSEPESAFLLYVST